MQDQRTTEESQCEACHGPTGGVIVTCRRSWLGAALHWVLVAAAVAALVSVAR